MVAAARSLRIVFFGSPDFAVPTLEALLASTHRVVAVVTQPDRPRGRGHRLSEGAVKRVASSAGLAVLQPASLKAPEFTAAFAALDADLGVVAAYGKLLPESLLAGPRLGMINVHASLLPKYRGAAPIHRAVAAGETETGISIMRVVKALDAGPVLDVARRPIGPDETSLEVEHDLAALGARLLVDTVDRIAAGRATETPQDPAAATYAARLTREDGIVDWTRPAADIHNLVRALHPWPHAFSFLHDRRVILLASDAGDAAARPSGGAADAGVPGAVLVAHGDELRVATGAGALRITRLQTEGSRAMSAREFLAGHDVRAGDRFTPGPSSADASPAQPGAAGGDGRQGS